MRLPLTGSNCQSIGSPKLRSLKPSRSNLPATMRSALSINFCAVAGQRDLNALAASWGGGKLAKNAGSDREPLIKDENDSSDGSFTSFDQPRRSLNAEICCVARTRNS